MIRRNTLSAALVVLGIALLLAPTLVPLQSVLVHRTYPGTPYNETMLERRGYEVVAYENLSERGQELYVRTLQNGGEYTVPLGEGAPEFTYPTDADLAAIENYTRRVAMEGVVIERPPNADLPPADEPLRYAQEIGERDEEQGRWSNMSEEEARRQIARYDLMETRTTDPPLRSPPALARLLAAVVGVLAMGTGGYLRAKP